MDHETAQPRTTIGSSDNDDVEARKALRTAVRALSLLVCLGIVLIWIMMPTNTFRMHWLPNIRKKAGSSTFFGTQGSNLMMFTFPVLFLACLGCVYLHLGTKNTHEARESEEKAGMRKDYVKLLRRPVLVKGPLGIASGTELSFLLMFVVLLVWSLSMYLHNSFAAITPQVASMEGETMWQVRLGSAGVRLGVVGNIGLTFLFFPVTRGSSLLALFGLTSESSVKYHIWLGHAVMTLFSCHGLCIIIYWSATHQISQMGEWAETGISNVAGEIALLFGLVLWSMTFPRIRRKMFELFYYTHHLYLLFVLFFILHVGISYACMMLPGIYLFLLDRYLRFLQSRGRARVISSRILPCDVVELNFAKSPGLMYNPTSIMFVNVPAVSKLQWHPFTISSDCNLERDKLSVIIKKEGSWSSKLCEILASSPIDRLEVAVEGPYGPVSTHFLGHEKLVMVSGGSGITPFISMIRRFIFTSTTSKSTTPELVLICAFKNSRDLSMLDLLLPMSDSLDLSNLRLKIDAYVTKEKGITADHSGKTRALWFQPSKADKPLSAILGPRSWLWLSAIISVSFVMFLVIIGIITRYYIYPINGSKNNFSTTGQAILNILVMCTSIAVIASACFLWNKWQNAKEAKQIQNLEGLTPSHSPGSQFFNTERELESLPRRSLAEATDFHFGERPHLERILLGCKESSVGVMVCGPKKMRHEVAAICSSNGANNLHFESISFSW